MDYFNIEDYVNNIKNNKCQDEMKALSLKIFLTHYHDMFQR